MQKRGQLTIIFIAGILLLAIAFFASMAQESAKKGEIAREIQSDPLTSINNYMQTCLSQTSDAAVYFVSLRGGYFNAPIASTQVLNANIAHYWDVNRAIVPTPERISEELGRYIESHIGECINDFLVFREQGFSIIDAQPKVIVALSAQNMVFSLFYPAKIKKGDSEFLLNEFSSTVSLPLGNAYTYANMILAEQSKTPDLMPIGYIAALAKEKGFTFEMINYEEDKVIVSLIFDVSPKDEYLYTFVNKYDWKNKAEN